MTITNNLNLGKRELSIENESRFAEPDSSSSTKPPVYYTGVSVATENPFDRINAELSDVKMMLRLLLQDRAPKVEKSDFMDITEASDLLRISKSTIYKMTSENKIPFTKREGTKKLIFSRSLLNAWVEESNVPNVNLVEKYLHMKPRVRRA